MLLKSIGIVGCGAIGQALLKAVGSGSLAVLIAGVTSRTEKSAREFLSNFENPPPYLPLRELIAASIDHRGGGRVRGAESGRRGLRGGKDLMVISAGALLDYPEIMQRSRQTGCRLYVPSGAIAGLDGSSLRVR
jgi:aspartate dehydrogenase